MVRSANRAIAGTDAAAGDGPVPAVAGAAAGDGREPRPGRPGGAGAVAGGDGGPAAGPVPGRGGRAAADRRGAVPGELVKVARTDGPGHFGMVFMPGTYRRTKQDTGRIIAIIEAKLAGYPGDEDLANGECWL
jgi:hypothetical protein